MLFHEPINPEDLETLSKAVQAWYRHYHASVDEQITDKVCSVAMNLFSAGNRTLDDLIAHLIETIPGPEVLRINAHGSNSIH
ncbi:hypothetical protein EV128_1261 [Rhizobium azibense]|nr:hypothetical protein EV128_1261 [Rhizobium azibense]